MKTEIIRLRLSADLVDEIRTLADHDTRTLAKQFEHLLKLALTNKGNK
jgi:hypothetical protein